MVVKRGHRKNSFSGKTKRNHLHDDRNSLKYLKKLEQSKNDVFQQYLLIQTNEIVDFLIQQYSSNSLSCRGYGIIAFNVDTLSTNDSIAKAAFLVAHTKQTPTIKIGSENITKVKGLNIGFVPRDSGKSTLEYELPLNSVHSIMLQDKINNY